MSTPTLFSLQGYLRIAEILPNGTIGKLRWLGNVPEAQLQLNTEAEDVTESFSGQRLQIGRLSTGTTAAFNYQMDYWSAANLALAVNANETAIAASTVTGETFPTGLVAGDLVRLDHPFVSSLIITDSAGTPATVPPANYRIEGHSESVVNIVTPGAFVQPFRAAYAYAAATNLALFSKIGSAVYLQFDGVNTVTNDPVFLEMWKVRHDPIKELALINKGQGNMPMTSAVLYDQTRALDPLLGGFGRMLQKAA
jgi:hypothetical protein